MLCLKGQETQWEKLQIKPTLHRSFLTSTPDQRGSCRQDTATCCTEEWEVKQRQNQLRCRGLIWIKSPSCCIGSTHSHVRWLHEDLNKVKQKPYVELKDLDSRRDDDTDMYKAWNDSAIVNACQGSSLI